MIPKDEQLFLTTLSPCKWNQIQETKAMNDAELTALEREKIDST